MSPFSGADFRLLIQGTMIVVGLFLVATILSVVIGSAFGLLRAAQLGRVGGVVQGAIVLVSALFRGVPLLIQMLFIFYGLGLLGVRLDPFAAATISLVGYGSANMIEIVRASLDSVPRGQWLAAQSLGMTYAQCMRRVIAPQAIVLAIPPTVGVATLVLKGTAIVSVLGMTDVVRAGVIVSLRTQEALLTFLLVGAIYLVLGAPLIYLGRKLEARMGFAR